MELDADPVSRLADLIEKQAEFFIGCAELDSVYEAKASKGLEGRLRGRRRGWVRADKNRFEYLCEVDDYLDEAAKSSKLQSVGPRPSGSIATRGETAHRILQWRERLGELLADSVKLCDANLALDASDAKTIRLAVECHRRWVDAYVKMSSEHPFDHDIETARWEALQALLELTKVTSSLEKYATHEDMQRLDAKLESNRFYGAIDEHCQLLKECVDAWERSGRDRQIIPPTLEAIAEFVGHQGPLTWRVLALLKSWLLKNPLAPMTTKATRLKISERYFELGKKCGLGKGTKQKRFDLLKPMFDEAGIEYTIDNLNSITKQYPNKSRDVSK